jgi:hypothetical protein
VALLLQETHSNSPTGKLLRMTIEVTKVEIGVGGSLFMQSFDRYGTLGTDSWVKHTWRFLSEYGITIDDKVGDLFLWHRGDEYLMRIFVQHGYKGAALRRLNACRLFLRVETLSDITTADGRYISRWALEGCAAVNPIAYHAWLNQGEPGKQAWVQWQHALSQCLCGGYLKHGLLHTLSHWIG